MAGRILVAYASRTGSAASVAEAIGKVLGEGGASVDVRPVQEVEDLDPYRAVVVGSAIRGGRWLPEAMRFVESHQATLARKPFAAFLVCITLGAPSDRYREGVATWLEPVRALVRPVSEGLFAGELDFGKLPLTLDTLGLRAAVALRVLPRGDHRDWGKIRGWAKDLAPALRLA